MRLGLWVTSGAVMLVAVFGCERARDPDVKPGAPGSLMEADRQFAAATAQARTEGWVSWFAEDGSMLLPGGEVQGHEAIREAMQELFSDPTYALGWEPEREELGTGGHLGYTVGRFRGVHRAADGRWIERTGHYVTIWRRGPNGWKVALDVGVPDPPAVEATPDSVPRAGE